MEKTTEMNTGSQLTQQTGNKTRLIPVPKWNDYHVWPPVGGLRHLIFYEKSNGFSSCVVRIGRRVLIDEEKFFEWAAKGKDVAA